MIRLPPRSALFPYPALFRSEEAPQPGVVTSAEVSVKVLPQASTAVATANTGEAGHSIVLRSDNHATELPSRSPTLMGCLAVLLLPQASVAVQVRVTLEEAPQ